MFRCGDNYNDQGWYFRFRFILDKDDVDKISRQYKATDSVITSYFEKSEVVDFRVNEARNLPKTIREKIATCDKLKKIHFFLIRNESSEFKMGHSAFARFITRKVGPKEIIYVILGIITLGMISSLIATGFINVIALLYKYIKA